MAGLHKTLSPSTYEGISRALKVPASTIRYWSRQPGCPIKQGAPNDLDAIRAWRVSWEATNPPKSAGGGGKSDNARRLAEAKLALDVEHRQQENRLLKLKVLRAEEQAVPLAAVEAELRALARAVKSALLGLPAALAPQLTGRSRREIETLLRTAIDSALVKASRDHSPDPSESPAGSGPPGSAS